MRKIPGLGITVVVLAMGAGISFWLWYEQHNSSKGAATIQVGERPAIDDPASKRTTPFQMEMEKETPVRSTLPPISPEVADAIRRMSKPTMEGAKVEQMPDGTVRVYFDGHYQQTLAAALDEDGNIVISHGEVFLENIKE